MLALSLAAVCEPARAVVINIDAATLQVVIFGCCSTAPGAPPTYISTEAEAAAQSIAQTHSATSDRHSRHRCGRFPP